MKFTTKDNKMYTALTKEDIGTGVITIFGETYKLNESVHDLNILGKHYDFAIPVAVADEDNDTVRGALLCFPKVDYEAREIDKPLADYTSGEKVLYTICFEGEE